MLRRFVSGIAALSVVFLSASVIPTFAGAGLRAPNVVLIVADDLGWADTAVTGGRYFETPNLDRLAAQGVRFTNAYAAAHLCSPSRAAILTGRYPARIGLTTVIREGRSAPARGTQIDKTRHEDVGRPLLPVSSPYFLPSTELTLPESLHAAGYISASLGKWHLGAQGSLPQDHGFDFNFGGNSWGRPPSYFDPYTSPYLTGKIGFSPRHAGEYLLDRETETAISFVREHRDRPFFLFWSTYGVHKPLEAKPEKIAYFRRKIPPGSKVDPVYAAMVSHLDDSVGRLLALLDTLDLSHNTLVIFTSDNGADDDVTDNRPLRGGKGGPYEGGLRVPLFVRWPAAIQAGGVDRTMVSGIDLFPTILGAVHVPLPPDRIIDGIDLLPSMRTGAPLKRNALFWSFPHYQLAEDPAADTHPYAVVRKGNRKLIHFFRGKEELFDLARDPGETKNLALSDTKAAEEMNGVLQQWLDDVDAARPLPNPNFSVWNYRFERLRALSYENYMQLRILLSQIKQAILHAGDRRARM